MRWRLILVGVVFLAGLIGGAWWNYVHGSGYAVKQLRAAYEKQDAARAGPFLTTQGRALFALALDPDNYTTLTAAQTELQEKSAEKAVYHFHGLTRFGPLAADLRLIRVSGHWRLDDVYLVSIGGFDFNETASSLLPASGP